MASAAAIGIMREEAYSRLEAVTTKLLGKHGLEASEYKNLSKDPDIAVVRTLEAIAGDLEALDGAQDGVQDEGDAAAPKAIAGDLEAILQGNAKSAAKAISEIADLDNLRTLLAVETAGQARKTIIDAITIRTKALG